MTEFRKKQSISTMITRHYKISLSMVDNDQLKISQNVVDLKNRTNQVGQLVGLIISMEYFH
jgi:hypothetical protein